MAFSYYTHTLHRVLEDVYKLREGLTTGHVSTASIVSVFHILVCLFEVWGRGAHQVNTR